MPCPALVILNLRGWASPTVVLLSLRRLCLGLPSSVSADGRTALVKISSPELKSVQ